MPENDNVRNKDLQELGKRIKALRKSRGMTVEDLSEKVGIANSEIVNIEQGSKDFTFLQLLRLTTALGIAPYELLQ